MRTLDEILDFRIQQEREMMERNNRYLARVQVARMMKDVGFTVREIAVALDVSVTEAHRLIHAYC
jgi:DNA-directed RNA polymerase specialized sigma24 family protein